MSWNGKEKSNTHRWGEAVDCTNANVTNCFDESYSNTLFIVSIDANSTNFSVIPPFMTDISEVENNWT